MWGGTRGPVLTPGVPAEGTREPGSGRRTGAGRGHRRVQKAAPPRAWDRPAAGGSAELRRGRARRGQSPSDAARLGSGGAGRLPEQSKRGHFTLTRRGLSAEEAGPQGGGGSADSSSSLGTAIHDSRNVVGKARRRGAAPGGPPSTEKRTRSWGQALLTHALWDRDSGAGKSRHLGNGGT